jgi:hypothetical protein
MALCLFCDSRLGEATKLEHILLNALGGGILGCFSQFPWRRSAERLHWEKMNTEERHGDQTKQ